MVKPTMRVALGATVAIALSACAGPEVTTLSADVHEEEDGITGLSYDPDALGSVVIDPGATEHVVELAPVPVSQSFDRVNVRWEAITGGGGTLLEVSPDGTGQWFPVTVDFEEFVPESGVTLYAGHADVTLSAESIQ